MPTTAITPSTPWSLRWRPPGATQRLSRYFQRKDDPATPAVQIEPPWPGLRAEAADKLARLIVSHRVRKKLSGQLHKETNYSLSNAPPAEGGYRFYTRRKLLVEITREEIKDIKSDERFVADKHTRDEILAKTADLSDDPKIVLQSGITLGSGLNLTKKVRLRVKRLPDVMVETDAGYTEPGEYHSIRIFNKGNDKFGFRIFSKMKEKERVNCRIRKPHQSEINDGIFIFSLAKGDTLSFRKAGDANQRYWVVQKIASKGQISLVEHFDALSRGPTLYEPTVGGLMSLRPEKISVDPIGRIRPARD